MTNEDIEKLINLAQDSCDYRIVKRLRSIETYNVDDGSDKRIGLVVDVETTGLDYKSDRIIEIGLVSFEYSPATGKIFRIITRLSQLEDPGCKLSQEIVGLTGITDSMVSGCKIKDDEVNSIANTASLVIAHNAAFDRKFMEKRFPVFIEKPWACSMSQVRWKKEGISSSKLDYISYKFGFFVNEHRAINDAEATLHILGQTLPLSRSRVLSSLLANAYQRTIRLWAINTPFAAKDKLKARSYRWNDGADGQPKAWSCLIFQNDLESEMAFLADEIYQGTKNEVKINEIDALTRFSTRECIAQSCSSSSQPGEEPV